MSIAETFKPGFGADSEFPDCGKTTGSSRGPSTVAGPAEDLTIRPAAGGSAAAAVRR